ncbi:MAG TPA: hypothetical protein VIC28_05370 [Thermoanaerobaculia bacterium]|jgi:hypothetical protein
MSFKVRDLMATVLPAEPFACSEATKNQGVQCVDPTKPPQGRAEAEETAMDLAALRQQLREALP